MTAVKSPDPSCFESIVNYVKIRQCETTFFFRSNQRSLFYFFLLPDELSDSFINFLNEGGGDSEDNSVINKFGEG